ncbi:unnamed protein product [Caenorhabditis auriculariae]|uniref:Methanethiol oxidase n=1 Tax=Caenorhabditis auriculariae TaxID=2777116 RepID=A0A8S1HTR0_9PELO|nr:unnamed protein product [Caenorhabditis auriculariae]
MISSEWGAPNVVKKGFHMEDVIGGKYGHSLHVFRWSTHERIQTIELPVEDGSMPLELKFLHEPTSEHAFVGCALGSTVYHLHPKYNNTMDYQATDVINIASKKVEGWMLPLMPALITDILVSMDDRMLYVSCWLHGDIRQYDISNPAEPNLVGQVYIGGSIHDESGVTVVGENAPKALYVKRTKIEGGPHLMQLSLDGKRMYVTTSLNNAWDEQFYPNLRKVGATMVLLDINPTGGMKINQDFLVEFGKLPGGPYLAHEMRFPGGDCTSDIWI